MSNPLMADISNNDSGHHLDFAEYVHAGHVAIGIKASEGESFTDPFHRGWCLRAGGHHVAVFHYHFGRPDLGTDPVSEADHFLSVVRPLAGPRDYVVLDLERPTPEGWVHDPAWSRGFDQHVRAHSRFKTILYISSSQLMDSDNWLVAPPKRVWEANWSTQPNVAPPGYSVAIRQYTDGVFGPGPHSAAGIGQCDMSRISPHLYREILNARRR